MSLYKRNGIWYFDVYDEQGRRVRSSTRTGVKALAEKRQAKTLNDIDDGRWSQRQRAKRTSFKELWGRYRAKYEKQRDSTSIKHLMKYFGEMMLSEIDTESVADYILSRHESGGAKPQTVYLEYSLGRRMYNIARRTWKMTIENYFC